MKGKRLKTANVLRNTARYILLIIGILVFIFALLSGAEKHGDGLSSIIQNSPNALPWALLLLLVFIAWKKELIGGIIITLLGFAMFFFFVIAANRFYLVVFLLNSLIIILGLFFIASWYLRKEI